MRDFNELCKLANLHPDVIIGRLKEEVEARRSTCARLQDEMEEIAPILSRLYEGQAAIQLLRNLHMEEQP